MVTDRKEGIQWEPTTWTCLVARELVIQLRRPRWGSTHSPSTIHHGHNLRCGCTSRRYQNVTVLRVDPCGLIVTVVPGTSVLRRTYENTRLDVASQLSMRLFGTVETSTSELKIVYCGPLCLSHHQKIRFDGTVDTTGRLVGVVCGYKTRIANMYRLLSLPRTSSSRLANTWTFLSFNTGAS